MFKCLHLLKWEFEILEYLKTIIFFLNKFEIEQHLI